MNPSMEDETRITRYLLGECDAQEEAFIRGELEHDPVAAAEARKVEMAIRALREGAVVPDFKLTPAQRRSILQPAAPARVLLTSSATRPLPAKKSSVLLDTLYHLGRVAAVIALAVGAFLLGQKVQRPASSGTSELAQSKGSSNEHAAIQPVQEAETSTLMHEPKAAVSSPVTADAKPDPEPAKAKVQPSPAPVDQPQEATFTATPAPAPKEKVSGAKPAASPPAVRSFTVSPKSYAFANASREPKSEFVLHPGEIRPAPPKTKQPVFAKPLDPGQKPKPAATPPKLAKPPIYVHSWRSDVAACPWNPGHRLMRVVIQVPANQPAAESKDFSYPLQVEFDPHHVRDYRLLCERHIEAPDLDRAGTHILWYEFSPNGAPAKFASVSDKPVATLSLPGVRFTTQTVGPFDESRLIVEDPGLPWGKVRDDFAYESAVVGFGLLLRSAGQTGSLNHDLVLKLAREARGESPHAERDRFIKLVEDAQKAAGL